MAEIQEQGAISPKKIDINRIIIIGLSRWYWVVSSITICLFAAYINLRYTPNTYQTATTIKLEDKKSALADLLSSASGTNAADPVQTESYILKSQTLIERTLKSLNYSVAFYKKGAVLLSETYPYQPYQIDILSIDNINGVYPAYTIEPINNDSFLLSYLHANKNVKVRYGYNQVITYEDLKFRIHKPLNTTGAYIFRFNNARALMGRVRNNLIVNEVSRGSNILLITLTDNNFNFAADFLNELTHEYQSYNQELRTQSATQTLQFIDNQLDDLAIKVNSSQTALADYQKDKGMINVSDASSLAISQLTSFESQKSLLEIQSLAINQLERQVNAGKGQISYNFNVEGASDPLLIGLVGQYNSVISEKAEKELTYKPTSTVIAAINQKLIEIQQSILSNIASTRKRIASTIAYLNNQVSTTNGSIHTLPNVQKNIIKLTRDFNINEKVFTYLMEKKLETQVNRASLLPGSTVVEKATPNERPIAPVRNKTYMFAFAIGLLIPVLLIILIRLFNPYINSIQTVEELSNTPVLGIIRRYPGKIDPFNRQLLSTVKLRTVFAESVRAVRTSLSFMAKDMGAQVIGVTSEIAGEGKSFVSINLAITLSYLDKRVVVIGTDLRRSKLHLTFDISNKTGLSTYLDGKSTLPEVIHKSKLNYLDFIPSGPVPTNPSEMLHSKTMHDLIVMLKDKYDYIFLDNAPVGLVSDAMPLLKQCDINLFVIRGGISKLSSVALADSLRSELRLDNLVMVVNGFKEDAIYDNYYVSNKRKYDGYYGTYNLSSGYYTDEEVQQPWWKFWKKS
ncbi:polysaccharide biosynthesis tyrosine autokinase [Mucilaginibacter sp. HMF5004]|uniref:GumC family protein n=1 Tax=Mucilaginibacter rivuli TaxID=2857527 RepID=UPI001C5E5FC0|nr:polysaccharide biosynthesis tyrosine autokinase [Mucilaginibacter rivuli]MBW4890077.1 polysaccharide biosynthesis tyrosine autokinase [Mucilaginibacter rivuli]